MPSFLDNHRQGSLHQRPDGHNSWFFCSQAWEKSLDHELEGPLASRKCCFLTKPERSLSAFLWHSDKETPQIPLEIHSGQSGCFPQNGTSSKKKEIRIHIKWNGFRNQRNLSISTSVVNLGKMSAFWVCFLIHKMGKIIPYLENYLQIKDNAKCPLHSLTYSRCSISSS